MILDEILEQKREEIAELRRRGGFLREEASSAPPVRSFGSALRLDGEVAVIAEFKRRSPSEGPLRPDADPAETARAYREAGAAAVSVLTDRLHFGGSLEDLRRARRGAGDLPMLRKDFLLDPVQVAEARASGADAVLLIVRALGERQLEELLAAAREHGMGALVEVHDEAELERAIGVGSDVVGVNARDLKTFRVDLDRAAEVLARVPDDRVAVAESGVRTAEDVERIGRAGADAVLVGTALMRSGPSELLPRLVGRPGTAVGRGR